MSIEEAEELSLASEWISGVPPAEFSPHTAGAFTDPGSEGNPGGNPNLDMNWMGGKRDGGRRRRGVER